MPDTELQHRLKKLKTSSVGVFTLEDGTRMTAQIVERDLPRELVFDVISSGGTPKTLEQRVRLPISGIVGYEPLPAAEQPWPYSDPCRLHPYPLKRQLLMIAIFLSMLGVIPVYFLIRSQPWGLQWSSVIAYSLWAVHSTFAAGRGVLPIRFTCPAVRPQYPRLIRRHFGFLVALVLLQTAALAAQPNLPAWWNVADARGNTLFAWALFVLCGALAVVQTVTNRSLIKRAHQEYSA